MLYVLSSRLFQGQEINTTPQQCKGWQILADVSIKEHASSPSINTLTSDVNIQVILRQGHTSSTGTDFLSDSCSFHTSLHSSMPHYKLLCPVERMAQSRQILDGAQAHTHTPTPTDTSMHTHAHACTRTHAHTCGHTQTEKLTCLIPYVLIG